MIYTSLMYHEVSEDRITNYSVSPCEFLKQIDLINQAGIVSFIPGNKLISGKDNCFITFDDGHKSNLNAARLLSERGIVGCFYLIKDYSLKRDDYLSESDIKEIASLGHILGVHGKTHRQWKLLDEVSLVNNLNEAKDWIEQLTGKEVNTCSAPGGAIDQRTINIIKNEIPELKFIRTSRYGINHDGDTTLNSIDIQYNYTPAKVLKIAQNDRWEMSKLMLIYKAKESLKPLYHRIKGIK